MLSFSRSFALKCPFRPLGPRVVVEVSKAGKEKVGSLYVPESAQKSSNEGIVVAVGPGRVVKGKLVAPDVKVGDKVLLPQFGGQTIKVPHGELTIFMEEDILGVLQ